MTLSWVAPVTCYLPLLHYLNIALSPRAEDSVADACAVWDVFAAGYAGYDCVGVERRAIQSAIQNVDTCVTAAVIEIAAIVDEEPVIPDRGHHSGDRDELGEGTADATLLSR